MKKDNDKSDKNDKNDLIKIKPIETNNPTAIELINNQMDVGEVVKKVSVRTTVETNSNIHTVHQVGYSSGKTATFTNKKSKKK